MPTRLAKGRTQQRLHCWAWIATILRGDVPQTQLPGRSLLGNRDGNDRVRAFEFSIGVYGGETASTWITKLQVHVVMVANHFNPKPQNIVANDESYALAA